MATEELPDLPPYSEMILAAISALDENGGSNKSAISKYMESTYGELPQSHPSLLAAHLVRMKDAGELIMVKNNYLRPSSDTPPKRGRGRPPKIKSQLPEDHVPSSPRPRGRPPKPKDPLADAVAKVAGEFLPTGARPSKRGRPSKKARPSTGARAPPAAAPSPGGSVKRGRGRPPKVKAPVADVEA